MNLRAVRPPSSPGRCLRACVRSGAFTRAECALLLATLALLVTVVLPGLASSRPRSDRWTCFANLRQIGAAFRSWADDHGDRLPHRVLPSEGGVGWVSPLGLNAWYQFAPLSNELSSPKVLLCPADVGRQALDFSDRSDGGFFHPTFRNNAISYLLGHPTAEYPQDWLSADRNLRLDALNDICTVFVRAGRLALRPPNASVGWTTNMHVNSGNVLRMDGRVEQLDNSQLRAALNLPIDDNGSLHLLVPR